jgi:hypothetical protein
LLLNIGEIQNMARQNHVGGKVALMRGAWVYDDWWIPDLLETYAQGMIVTEEEDVVVLSLSCLSK